MSRHLRRLFVSIRAAVLAGGPFVVLAIALLVLADKLLQPAPPRHAVMVTGPERSALDAFGEQYRAALAKQGFVLELRRTGGTSENLEALRKEDGEVSFGFVQGGAVPDDERGVEGLENLGALFYEPVWVFHKRAPRKDRAVRLLEANRIDSARLRLLDLPETEAVMALLDDRIDAVLFVSAPESTLVQMLLQTPGVNLLDFPQAEAYARRFPFLSPVTLPRGIVAIDRDIPARNHPLVATTTSLVVRDGTHPALVQLMIQAADRIHGGPGWFRHSGEFPLRREADLPVATEANRLYDDGAPFLQRYLPWWLANLLDRMWLALVAIVAVLVPLSRIVPPLYEYRVRARVFKWHAQQRAIEDEVASQPAAGARAALLARLDDLGARVERVTVPLSYADELYALRHNIAMVRGRLG